MCALCRTQIWREPGRWLLSVWQIVASVPIVGFHGLIVYRMCYVSFGLPAVLFSPGVAWSTPLIFLMLRTHYDSYWSIKAGALPARKKVQGAARSYR